MRGAALESAHRGAIAVVDADGSVVAALGDIERPIFPRSAVKVLQALPLVESGAADALGLDDEELALACASHNGEPAHAAVVARMLAKAGLDAGALECGAHWPYREAVQRALAAAGRAPDARCTTTARASTPASCAWPARWPAARTCARFAARLRAARAPGDARGHRRAAGRDRLRPRQRRRAAPTAARSRPTRSRCATWRSPSRASARASASATAMPRRRSACARAVARAPVHGRRHRPLRHPRDGAPRRARVLQGRRRGRVLRRAARARPRRGDQDRRRQQRARLPRWRWPR